MDGIPRIIPLSWWLCMGVSYIQARACHKLIVLILAVNTNLPEDISIVQMRNGILFMKESTLMNFDAPHEAVFYASVTGFRWDVGRLLGPVHFTCDGWYSVTSDVDLDGLPDLIDWDM
ncbi:hypothetical protein B0H10DRAFT_2231603 [Mycena sp. CBHHK59/15]|nr:hypothetical protein B0H10DRAFT_2231603 [Mycena sp. CBHHK59/15]